MNKKRIGGIIILLFVALSIVVLVAKERAEKENVQKKTAVQTEENTAKNHIKVFYFHGKVRCPSCKKIEAYTKETVGSKYKTEMENGLIEFHEINIDKPENEKYIEKYQLMTKQVIVAEYKKGKETKWKNLDRIWELLGDKEQFQMYQDMEISEWIKEIKE